MKIFALGDPHLALGIPGKSMDKFGPHWLRHHERIRSNWLELVSDEDMVLLPGDISWASRIPEAGADLRFFADLPGEKVLIKGNHDYWWNSFPKVKRAMPERMHAIEGNAIHLKGVLLTGTRLWDHPSLHFEELIAWEKGEDGLLPAALTEEENERNEKIFERELGRLRRGLGQLEDLAKEHPDALRIVMTHYPPLTPDQSMGKAPLPQWCEEVSKHKIAHLVFGHLHALKKDLDRPLFGTAAGVSYHLCSCDWIDFKPIEIAEITP